MKKSFNISGKIIDILNDRIFSGTITVTDGKIADIREEEVKNPAYIVPGLIDAHVHIESSMLIPSEFARLAVTHGTVATVSDPHEIANVMGIEGIKYMIENGHKVPFKFYFGASSCVPATPFESSGAEINLDDLEELMQMKEIKYMSEMMNWPGVVFGDEEVEKKLEIAKKYNKPVDGHAPGIKGEQAEKYAKAGISTDHECYTMEEALDKINDGMHILIREGSAAKNFDALIDLLKDHPERVMFCSDDKHPNDLVKGHINELVKRAINRGYDPVTVLRAASLNPVKHYDLEVGLLQKGDPADFILVDEIDKFNVLATYINGERVGENAGTLIDSVPQKPINRFNIEKISTDDIRLAPKGKKMRVIEAEDGQLITKEFTAEAKVEGDNVVSDTDRDILKMIVLNRYEASRPAIGFVKNFMLKKGAIASTVAHDSHNIIAVGTTDEEIARAINMLIENKGGVSLVDKTNEMIVPLPVAGLMSNKNAYDVARDYDAIDTMAKSLGSRLNAPYMTLSFMALLVIPDLKLSDKGLFDGKKFEFTALFEE